MFFYRVRYTGGFEVNYGNYFALFYRDVDVQEGF
jgi:hypothetical protein